MVKMTTDTFADALRRAANAVRDIKTLSYTPADYVCVIHPDTLAQVRDQYVAGCTIAGEPICLTDEEMLGRKPYVTAEAPVGKIEYMALPDACRRFVVSPHYPFPTKE